MDSETPRWVQRHTKLVRYHRYQRDRIALVHVTNKSVRLSFPRDLLSRNMRYMMIYRFRENDIGHGAIVKLFKFVI